MEINTHLNNALEIIRSANVIISATVDGSADASGQSKPSFMPNDPSEITLEYWNSLTEEQQKYIHLVNPAITESLPRIYKTISFLKGC